MVFYVEIIANLYHKSFMKKLGLMTVAEAADYLNVPRPTLYQHLREGHIPGIQIGGRWRIELTKLNEFIGRAKRGTSEDEDELEPNPFVPHQGETGETNLSGDPTRQEQLLGAWK